VCEKGNSSHTIYSYCKCTRMCSTRYTIDNKIESISANLGLKPPKIQILSNLRIHDRRAKKPSHATIPLNREATIIFMTAPYTVHCTVGYVLHAESFRVQYIDFNSRQNFRPVF
jgi:hypothetical protein